MTVGFVLLHVSPVHENEVFNILTKIPEVIEVHPISGEYDIIAKIEGKDNETIAQIIIEKINIIPGIIDIKILTGKNLR